MDKFQNLIDVKLALAEKYQRLANLTGSKPRRATLARHAEKFRRQATQIERTRNLKSK